MNCAQDRSYNLTLYKAESALPQERETIPPLPASAMFMEAVVFCFEKQ
jgi:hypothetical protein